MARKDVSSGVRIKRVYEPAEPGDGARILVDRLWPRRLSKAAAKIDEWMKDIAPSTALRQWFGHDPNKWEEFRRRYRAELANNIEASAALRAACACGPVTLVYGAQDETHNQAVVLCEWLGRKAPARPRKSARPQSATTTRFAQPAATRATGSRRSSRSRTPSSVSRSSSGRVAPAVRRRFRRS